MLKNYLNEAINIIEMKLNTKSTLIKGWSEKFNAPEEYILIMWKRAICVFLNDGKKGCKPKESDWPIIVNIFKAEMKKYLSKVDKEIKFVIKNPTVDGKKANIHYDEARKISLKKVIKEYEDELKQCCGKCKKICEE